MKKQCPRCGARFDQSTLRQLEQFDFATVVGGTVTCTSCGTTMALNEVAGSRHTDLGDYGKKAWWQFWK